MKSVAFSPVLSLWSTSLGRIRSKRALCGKMVTRTKRLKAHDEQNSAKVGDTVRIVETRPLSKDKRWRLLEIVERAR
mgnify:CR=1 FL=1